MVKIYPWSFAQLNPENPPLCIESYPATFPHSSGISEVLKYHINGSLPPLEIPIALNGTTPWKVTLSLKPDKKYTHHEARPIEYIVGKQKNKINGL